jgi:hypothetical protein
MLLLHQHAYLLLFCYSIDFTILSEGGNYEHWHYTAQYTEFLLSLPFIHNFADGHFNVKPSGGGVYVIQSTHNTCFFTRLLCCMYAGRLRKLMVELLCILYTKWAYHAHLHISNTTTHVTDISIEGVH